MKLPAHHRIVRQAACLSLLFGLSVSNRALCGPPEFVATQVHQAVEQVYGLAWGNFDPLHEGAEVACLTQSGSVLQLSPGISGWEVALRHTGQMTIGSMGKRPTIGIGDVYSEHPGNEVIINGPDSSTASPSTIVMVFYDAAIGWRAEILLEWSGYVGMGWGARVGDFDPRLAGDEIFHIYEHFFDISAGTILSNIDLDWRWDPRKTGCCDEELVYHGYVGMDSAAGDFNPDHAGPEIVVVTEMGPAYELIPPEANGPGTWTGRMVWDDYYNAGWVVKIGDVDPCHPGNEIIYGTRGSNRITMSHHNGEQSHELQILFTGNATGDTRSIWDIAVGDVLWQNAGLEILGVDHTGSVYLVRRVEDSWQGQVIWQDANDPLYAVIAGDFLPARPGDEILVGGESGTLTLLTLKFTGDFTGDGRTNFEDFAECVRHWGQDEPSIDVAPWPYGDGIVNMLDLVVLIDNWLAAAYWLE